MNARDRRLLQSLEWVYKALQMAHDSAGVPFTEHSLSQVRDWWSRRVCWQAASVYFKVYDSWTPEERSSTELREALVKRSGDLIIEQLEGRDYRPGKELRDLIFAAAAWADVSTGEDWSVLELHERCIPDDALTRVMHSQRHVFAQEEGMPRVVTVVLTYLRHDGTLPERSI
jgi:hypothetical protein